MLCSRFLLSIHSKGGQVRGQISRPCKDAVDARPEDPHELKMPFKYTLLTTWSGGTHKAKTYPSNNRQIHRFSNPEAP